MTGSTAEIIWLLVWFLVIAVAFARSMRRVRTSQAVVSANEVAHGSPSSRAQGRRALPLAWTGILLAGAATGATPLRGFVESPNVFDGVLVVVITLLCLFSLQILWRYLP